ncbi:hypothetical protein [Frankia sp. CiP3]|uniref:hypothetical protein n=1 Tax=Frankia sp. CiP3 TaxID=2880971 RepID=UPI001EF5B591|nr:hypothetical protein [Frankia sp. CiP3]
MTVEAGTGSQAVPLYERVRQALGPREWATIAGMTAVIVGLHVIGWFTLVAVIAPHHYRFGTHSQVFGVRRPP